MYLYMVNIYTAWMLWKGEKRHECTNLGKLRTIRIMLANYVTLLPIRELHDFRPQEFAGMRVTRCFRGRDYFYYCYLTKIIKVTPNTVPCTCVSGNPPNMMVVQLIFSLVSVLLSSTAVERCGVRSKEYSCALHGRNSLPLKTLRCDSTNKISTTFHAVHSPLTSSKWVAFLRVY